MLDILQCLGTSLTSDPHKEAPTIEIPNTPFSLHIHDNTKARQVMTGNGVFPHCLYICDE